MGGISSDTSNSWRTVIGDRIRSIRLAKGMSVAELAERSGYNRSTISRIEGGKLKPSEANITRLVHALGLTRSEKRELLDIVIIMKTELSPWIWGSAEHVAENQRIFRDRERRARQIRNFEMFLISGLLQTPDYMKGVFRRIGLVSSDMNKVIEARLERQKIWKDRAREIRIILWEPVLRSRMLPVSQHKQQLRHILSMAEKYEESIRVLPMDVMLDLALMNSFWIFDNTLISIETVCSEIRIWTPDAVKKYHQSFQMMNAAAVSGDSLHNLIRQYL